MKYTLFISYSFSINSASKSSDESKLSENTIKLNKMTKSEAGKLLVSPLNKLASNFFSWNSGSFNS